MWLLILCLALTSCAAMMDTLAGPVDPGEYSGQTMYYGPPDWQAQAIPTGKPGALPGTTPGAELPPGVSPETASQPQQFTIPAQPATPVASPGPPLGNQGLLGWAGTIAGEFGGPAAAMGALALMLRKMIRDARRSAAWTRAAPVLKQKLRGKADQALAEAMNDRDRQLLEG